jgi:hypothetical protein
MHLDNLGGMPNRQAGVRTAEAATFGGENGLVTNQQHLNITFLRSLESPLNGGSRSMVTAHDIKRNFHGSRVLIE